MSDEQNQIAIEDLELSLEVYEIESEQKLAQLQKLFEEKGALDLSKMFYEERSTTKIKFQNIIGDLIEFLVKQEVATTEKLRKTFYRILDSPLLLLFKISRFEIFDLRLNGFDIQLQPIEAITELGKSLDANIDQYLQLIQKSFDRYQGKEYSCWDAYMEQAIINMIQDKIFVLYSYLRKGSALLKKKFENKIKIVDIFNNIEEKLLGVILENKDKKTLKELSLLNYEIYQLEDGFNVLNFYMKIPFREIYQESFQEFEIKALKAKKSSNYNSYILEFVKYGKEIISKIKTEKIDPCYDVYLQNALKAILEMWGCRICYYQQFFILFTTLFDSHSNKIKILQLCLQHTPNMQKDDIVLLRKNFQLQISKKHEELLSLMKSKSLEDINQFLNSFYHRQFYNMDFNQIEREDIIKTLTMMNGNSSLTQFFSIVQRAIKQWNYTIDFYHPHKYIDTEFTHPEIGDNRILQSFKLLTNLCVLEEKGFNKEYEELIRGNTIGKALLGFIEFIRTSQKCASVRKSQEAQKLITQTFFFLGKCLNPGTQAENLALKYAPLIDTIQNEEQRNRIETGIIQYVIQNISNFHIRECLEINSKLSQHKSSQIIRIFFRGIADKNSLIKMFRFFDQKLWECSSEILCKEEQQFIRQNCVIKNNNFLSLKDTGILKITQFEIMTNPTQFQKVLDNFYFTLDSNSKKFIEYMVGAWYQQWTKSERKTKLFEFYSSLIKQTLRGYPVAICLLASTRIEVDIQGNKENRRFCEFLAEQISTSGQVQSSILQLMINCRCIKYRNGKDYVQQQILPMILKVLIVKINQFKYQQSKTVPKSISESVAIAAIILQKSNLRNYKSDTIQKMIEKTRYLLTKTNDPCIAEKMAQSHHTLLKVFFEKKEMDLRKTDLLATFQRVAWNQTRNYSSSNENEKPVQDQVIPQQIIVTPYTVSQEYNIQEYTIKNVQGSIRQQQTPKEVKLSTVLASLQKVQQKDIPMYFSSLKDLSSPAKKIELKDSKHNLLTNLGEEMIQWMADKQNLYFVFEDQSNKTKEVIPSANKADENNSFVQFYIKEFQVPPINHRSILENVIDLLEVQRSNVSFLWTNPKNLEYYFMNLFSIFEFAALEKEKRRAESDQLIDKLVKMIDQKPDKILQQILQIFENLGYSNIWGQSLNMYWINFPIRKHLGLNTTKQQSILSIILSISLTKQSLKPNLNRFLGSLFETRDSQTNLMYKVVMDKTLMNLIMKSLEIQHLNKISLLFHSNFNNLRLYTDQLHEGLKALNIASTNRSYNEYIKLSKTIEDEEFEGRMKLFRENFGFFIRIQKQGYIFKKNQEKKLVADRLTNLFRTSEQRENLTEKVDAIMKSYIKEIQQLQLTIANRVKSFYLVTKLRDLSYQNSLMISILQSVMKSQGNSTEQILTQIRKVQIFSLMNQLYNQLIIFEDNWRDMNKYSTQIQMDENMLRNQLTICSNKRFSHSMSKIYEKCDLQFDQVIQRCFDALKVFFRTPQGNIFMNQLQIYPAFLIKSFIDDSKAQQFADQIFNKLSENRQPYSFEITQQNLIENLVKEFRATPLNSFTHKGLEIVLGGKKYTPATILPFVIKRLQENQTLVTIKSTNYLIFNKYKTSEATLEEIEAIGYLICYCILTNTPVQLNLHPSIVTALSFNISDLQFLVDIDFKIWEQLKNVLSAADSAKLQLNFSYSFESLQDFRPVRIELVDKGSSKKVNNLNREEYCDLVCSYVLFENLRPQIHRLLKTILSIIPKEYICCKSTKSMLQLFYNRQTSEKILKLYMRKIGVVLPEAMIDEKNKRYENLKDFQNIQWLQQLILDDQKLRQKYWKDETNLLITTYIGSKGSIRLINGGFLVEHFNSKEQMKAGLLKL